LINYTNIGKGRLNDYLVEIIYNDENMKENNIEDIMSKLKILFSNKKFINHLKGARNNWLEIDEVLENIYDLSVEK